MRSRCRRHLVNVLERTQQTSLLRLAPRPLRQPHRNASINPSSAAGASTSPPAKSLAVTSAARFNQLGVQQVSAHVHSQLFPNASDAPAIDPELVSLSREHLARHDLLGKTNDDSAPIGFDLPALQGRTLDEHFFRLGTDSAEPYLTVAKKYARIPAPPRPRSWAQRSGWTKYHEDGSWEPVDYPDTDALTFDTEVMWKESAFPVMACAMSATHWYAWLSPWLLGESENDQHLIPMGDPTQRRIVIGHNIGYDRARISEEYDLRQSRNFFVDTMSLHVAVNGMCSRQRPTWNKHRKAREMQDKLVASEDSASLELLLREGGQLDEEADLWVGRSSVNSLRDVAKFHCGVTIDKARREWFGELDRAGVVQRLDELLDYCAADVDITHKVYKKVFPLFVATCPHPVSFAALRHLSSEILPVNSKWEAYLQNAEATYHKLSSAVEQRLVELTEAAVDLRSRPEVYQTDPWLSQLDWSGQEVRMVKGKKKNDPPRPAARQKKPGMPKWYKDLFASNDADISLTVRTRVAPLLFRMAWDGLPLVWSDKHGWTFKVPYEQSEKYRNQALTLCDMDGEENQSLRDDYEHVYFKLPHKDGAAARCASPLAQGYLQFFESGILSSETSHAKEALEMNASCSYWISARDRIMNQVVVYDKTLSDEKARANTDLGYILPQVIPMGTVTRRAVENTWLTASNAKKNRIGSELKSMITAPPGYCFVGADVDSQELWIASLVGDAGFQLHGGNAIGFMTLEGTKAAGTDLHSRTAKILGISRNDAKVFNYGRIYGAGLSFAQSLLRRFNPSLTEDQARAIAEKLYIETKGKKEMRKVLKGEGRFWRGGTESLVFNKLEEFADQERPRTPVLGAGITEALSRRFISRKGDFMTSRINWAIQSSGVDYLHLLIVSMEYLTRRYNIDARLSLTVHDEIRYLSREEDRYRCAMALQVANVWTRAMFSQQMGIDDLPQACAYFSAVDIDHVLRKEVDMDCITPSHPHPIPHGESLDILQLLARGDAARLDTAVSPTDPPQPLSWPYTPRVPVMETLTSSTAHPRAFLRAQITSDTASLNNICKTIKKPETATPSLDADESASGKKKATTSEKAPRKRKGSSADKPTALPIIRRMPAGPSTSLPAGAVAADAPARLMSYGGTTALRRPHTVVSQADRALVMRGAAGAIEMAAETDWRACREAFTI